MNVNPILQSVAAAVATAVATASLWHSVVITPIYDDIAEMKLSQKETASTVRIIEVNQARVAVSLENLARSIEGLANQIAIERQMHISESQQLVFPEVAHKGETYGG